MLASVAVQGREQGIWCAQAALPSLFTRLVETTHPFARQSIAACRVSRCAQAALLGLFTRFVETTHPFGRRGTAVLLAGCLVCSDSTAESLHQALVETRQHVGRHDTALLLAGYLGVLRQHCWVFSPGLLRPHTRLAGMAELCCLQGIGLCSGGTCGSSARGHLGRSRFRHCPGPGLPWLLCEAPP